MRCAYCALHGQRNGEFRSISELVDAIEHYVTVHNEDPKPFARTAKAKDVFQKLIRANSRLSSKQNATHP